MLKKLRRRVKTLITKPFKKPRQYQPHIKTQTPEPEPEPEPENPQTPPPSTTPTSTTMSQTHQNRLPNSPYLFPKAQSTVLPDPSAFFAPSLLSNPLPTNSFFQNFVLKNGDQPEYIHPYLIKSSDSSLSLCYPSRFNTSAFIYQVFNADLSISAAPKPARTPPRNHVVSAFNDLSLTLDIPAANLRAFLVRGSPFVTCSISENDKHGGSNVAISTIHAILSVSANDALTKRKVKLNNNQTWLIYSSSPITFSQSLNQLTSSSGFSGVLRVAILPGSDARFEPVLDRFSSCYPISGSASFTKPFHLEYKWEKKGWGDLLMLAHPLHLKLMANDDCDVVVLEDLKYNSIDGELVGVVGDSWTLKPEPVSVTWHSIGGVREEARPEIVSALRRDVEALDAKAITTSSSYFYGKLIARAARLALIAEEVCFLEAIPAIAKFLKEAIEPWLDGTFGGNGFLFDEKWGGIVTKQGISDSGADFGFGIYNDHHYHLGYFLYAIAVLAKIDSAWGKKYRPQAYSMMADFMTMARRSRPLHAPAGTYTRLRCFDLYVLHSWAGGLTEFADGRNQESTSEAVNAYYSAALLGLAYGDTHLVAAGSALAALEISAAQMWWHVREDDKLYEQAFTKENRVMGVLWANKRDSGLWFAPPEWKECRLGIQLLPLLPITEALFADAAFARALVEWTLPALRRDGVGEGWKGFVYALEGVYDRESALGKIRSLSGYDDGNSLTNLLWWIHSRDGEEGGHVGGGKYCWFGHYCH